MAVDLSKLHLPTSGLIPGTKDIGLTEALGVGDYVKSNILGGSTVQNSTSAPTPTPTTTGDNNSGGGSTPTSTPTGGSNANTQADNLTNNAADEAARKKAQEEAAKKAYEASMRKNISAAYDPIFAELDRQLGALPAAQADTEAQLSNLAIQQKTGVASDQSKSIASLEQSKQGEETTAKKSLRSLEEDIRNNLAAYAFYFGTKGAGDSSATGLASEAIAKGGLKARSNILGVRDEAFAAIDQKKADVDMLASEQNRKIDEWKSNKVYETVQYFKDKVDQLNQAKANASAEKQNAINNLLQNTHQDFITRLRNIDDNVTNFKQTVDTWKVQRSAELEDFTTKLTEQAKYTSDTPEKLQLVTDTFGNAYMFNPYTGGMAQVANQGQYTGLEQVPGSTNTEDKKNVGLMDILSNISL